MALDYFDASVNRVSAWVAGARAVQKAMLIALLEPLEALRDLEARGYYTGKLALLEELRALPFGVVWGEFCRRQNALLDGEWIDKVRDYEKQVLLRRRG